MRSFLEVRSRRASLAGVVSVLIAGQALGASSVTFTLQLGGDNHAALWKSATPKPKAAMFTPGNEADGQILPLNGNTTWSVKVAVGGTQSSGNGQGYPIKGLANVVMNLELHHDTEAGPLATGVIWNSTINDGTAGDTEAAAAFAASFNIALSGPGRVIDPALSSTGPAGGPFMGGPGWPKTGNPPKAPKNARTYPTAEPGMLIGMGAGYYQWSPGSGSTSTTPGVGIEGPIPNEPVQGRGIVPLFEGQMNTSNLPAGTYVLKVVPGAGINVLRGDISMAVVQNAFATAAEQTAGDTITFELRDIPLPGAPTNPNPADGASGVAYSPIPSLTWTAGSEATSHNIAFGTTNPPPVVATSQVGTSYTPASLAPNTTYFWQVTSKNLAGMAAGPVWSFTTAAPAPLTAVAWRSVKSHGGTDYGVSLNPTATGSGISVEPRTGGVLRLAIEFNRPADFIDNPVITSSNGVIPAWLTYTVNGNTLEMEFDPSSVSDGVCYSIDLAGAVQATDGSELMISGDTNCSFRALVGDANGNGVINLGDVLFVRAKLGATTAATARCDFDADGTVSITDQSLAKTRMGQTVSCP